MKSLNAARLASAAALAVVALAAGSAQADTNPNPQNVTGSLIGGGELSGTVGINFAVDPSASYTATITVDGSPAVNATVTQGSARLSLDTTTLHDGSHSVLVTVADGGDSATVWNGTIETDNAPRGGIPTVTRRTHGRRDPHRHPRELVADADRDRLPVGALHHRDLHPGARRQQRDLRAHERRRGRRARGRRLGHQRQRHDARDLGANARDRPRRRGERGSEPRLRRPAADGRNRRPRHAHRFTRAERDARRGAALRHEPARAGDRRAHDRRSRRAGQSRRRDGPDRGRRLLQLPAAGGSLAPGHAQLPRHDAAGRRERDAPRQAAHHALDHPARHEQRPHDHLRRPRPRRPHREPRPARYSSNTAKATAG